jgi:acyl-CoA synthetase (AMP-forming)/AMP-acid ligase II
MCVPDLVALQAHAVPDAVAIIGGAKKLTYGEMNARANHLANLLRSRGIKAEIPVALFLERSPELATAALAVLKAGGAYVPLDPSYPPARIAMLLEDSAARNHRGRQPRRAAVDFASSGEWEQRDPRDDHQLFERTAPSAGIADGTRGCGDEVRAAGNHQRLI